MNYKVYSVLFKNTVKPYSFKANFEAKIDDNVIVETEKGLQYGRVVAEKPLPENIEELKDIIRIATPEDDEIYYKNLKDSISAIKKCKEFIKELNLEMSIINASFNFDRSQLLFNFSADDRVDFRELTRKLANVYRTRIELHQIGSRDKAKLIGGVGICGRQLCCSKFLNQIESISITKAKNQNLALNPSKINGTCGRLLCCLCYEEEEYLQASKGLMPVGSIIKVDGKEGTITSIDILNRTYKVLVGDEKIEIKADELDASKK